MKKTLLLLFLNCWIIAQSQDFQWALSAGDWVDDTVRGLHTDKDGNVYVSGGLHGGTTIGGQTFDTWGAYIFKTNASGEVLWVRSFGDNNTYGIDVTTDSNGNVLLLGSYSRSFEIDGFSTPHSSGSRFVMMLDSEGTVRWIKTYGFFQTAGIGIDEDNNLYVAGNFEDDLTLGGVTYTVRGRNGFDADMIIFKLDSDGEIQWVKTPGSTSDEYLYDIDVSQNQLVVVGHMRGETLETSSGPFTTPARSQAVAISYSLDGELNWFNFFEANSHSVGYGVKIDQNGETLVIGGKAEGRTDDDRSIFISRLDANGLLLNGIEIPQTIPGIPFAKSYDIAISDDDVYITGIFRGEKPIGPLTYNSTGGSDVTVIKFNEVGYPQWFKNGEGNGFGVRIEARSSDVLLAGHYASLQLQLGETQLNNNSGNGRVDFFVTKLTDDTSNSCPDINSFAITHGSHFCEGDSLAIQINDPYTTYTKWSYNGNDLARDNLKELFIKEPGTYTLDINGNTRCPVPPINLKVDWASEASSETDIIIYPRPDLTFNSPEWACVGETLNISSTVNQNYDYAWVVPDQLNVEDTALSALNIPILEIQEDLHFQLFVTDRQTGCISADSTTVKVSNPPNVSLQQRGSNLQVLSSGVVSITWFLDGVPIEAFQDLENISAVELGNYSVQVTNEAGCTAVSESVSIDVILNLEKEIAEVAVFPNPMQDRLTVTSSIPIQRVEILNLSGHKLLSQNQAHTLDLDHLADGLYLIKIYYLEKVTTFRIRKSTP